MTGAGGARAGRLRVVGTAAGGTAAGGTGAAATLLAYRDDGPLAQALGRLLGPRLTLGALPLGGLGAAPLLLTAARREPRPRLVGAALGWGVLCLGAGSGRPHDRPASWALPPLLRATEYAVLLRLATSAGERPSPVPPCFGLLGALAFHHYDTVFRLQQTGSPPPAWVGNAGGGWELRLIAAVGLWRAGTLRPGLTGGAVALAGLYLTESALAWGRMIRTGGASAEPPAETAPGIPIEPPAEAAPGSPAALPVPPPAELTAGPLPPGEATP